MPPVPFTVSQVRTAAACPRIFYFDAHHTRVQGLKQPSVTRIWKDGGNETTACGTLFHQAIEQFNSQAADDPEVARVLAAAADSSELAERLKQHVYWQHVNRSALFQRTGPQQQAFVSALERYIRELSDILFYARQHAGKPLAEILQEMFGDRRRRVNVTFDLDGGDPVRVTGILDYVFYDWRTANNRIIDYKLTPASSPTNDLFQVCLYALMHHRQHDSQPDAAVLYLHPKREMIEKKWDELVAQQHVVLNLLAAMRDWLRYDEATGQGLKPPGEPLFCPACRWRNECERRLGPKNTGSRVVTSPAGFTSTPSPPAVRRVEHEWRSA